MSTGAVVIIVVGLIMGTGFSAMLMDYLQKRPKRASADDRQRIEMLERRLEIQDAQINELLENQKFSMR